MTKFILITSGNEILNGDVLDTNTNWLCNMITSMGNEVVRVAIVRDEVEAISKEIEHALSERVDVIITSGGLGPTADDLTLEAVANALHRKVILNRTALLWIKRKFRSLAKAGSIGTAKITDSREKMARLPEGSTPLKNSVGVAPGIILRYQESLVASLPGVPAELKAIFTEQLLPIIRKEFEERAYIQKEIIVDTNDESSLAKVLKEVASAHSDTYIKSRAKSFGKDIKIHITISTRANSMKVAKAVTSQVVKELIDKFGADGIKIISRR
ncbi:MAG: competence/damage-inducible protein A [Nitrososphaerota archaeon]|nr:competence/damage-inducible protein A [Nitrososphaerota archaeon]